MRHRLFQLFAAPVRFVCRAVLRAVITSLIFTASLWVASSYLGVPMPDPYELLERIESVSELSKILS